MKHRFFFLVLLLLTVLIAILASCTVPALFIAASPTPTATPRVETVIVVATPTPGPLPAGGLAGGLAGGDDVETRRIAVYQRVAPAVVNITTQVLRTDFFWGTTPEEGSGSGFLWDTDGHIVTNYHVIDGAQQIEVSFGGDTSLTATVVGGDPINDLAVLKVDSVPEGVQPVELGTSTDLHVGQTAIVIGNPFGQFERTMTQGIVSALNRTIQTDNSSVLRGVIQTDAAINHGNSGGPLLDSRGHLIGVNSAIYSPSGTSAGVGLAIPVDKVMRVVPVLIKQGRFPHPWLGFEEMGYEISPRLAQALNLPVQSGLLIAQLYRGSPADQAGVRGAQNETIVGNRRYLVGGDTLTAVDGMPLKKWDDLNAYLEEKTTVGQKIALTLVRGGKDLTLNVTLADMPESVRSR
jgi:S1-C subfamily serine protease